MHQAQHLLACCQPASGLDFFRPLKGDSVCGWTIERWVYRLGLENMSSGESSCVSVACLCSATNTKAFSSLSFIFCVKTFHYLPWSNPLVRVWHSTLGTRTHVTFSSIKLRTESLDNLECIYASTGMGEQGTHRCVVDCCVNSDLNTALKVSGVWRLHSCWDKGG